MGGIALSNRLLLGALALAWLLAGVAQAQDASAPNLRVLFRLPVLLDGRVLHFEAMELRPRGPGPFPLAVIAHGTPGTEDKRRQYTVDSYTPQALEFARRGFVALAFLRRGYGTSEGGYAESNGVCGRMSYASAGAESARDLIEAIRAMADRPYVDQRRVLVVGQSAGGFAALALSQAPPQGVLGIVDFAGGRGYFPDRNAVCEPEKLIEAVRGYGLHARLPSLWLYAENDKSFPPTLAKQMLQAYLAGGGRAEFLAMPPFGDDGHLLFAMGIEQWRAPVDDFLRRLGLPTLPASPLAATPPNARGKTEEAFRKYAASPLPNKAFALSARGAYAWKAGTRSVETAKSEALALCEKHGATCAIAHAVRDFDDQ